MARRRQRRGGDGGEGGDARGRALPHHWHVAGTHPVGTCEKAGRSCHPRQKREQNSRCLTAKDWCDRCAHAAAARASSLWVRVSRQAEARSLSDLLEGNGSASALASGLRAHCRCSSERERARGTCTGARAGGRLRASVRAGELGEHGQEGLLPNSRLQVSVMFWLFAI
jgi:hypothetical protein